MAEAVMTSPNPMALEAKALEAAREKTRLHSFSCLTRDEHDDLVSAAIRAYLAALPLPAAGEGLEPEADDPALPCDVSLPPNTVFRAGVHLSSLLVGLRVRGMATPAARAAVLEALLRGIVACTHRPNLADPARIDVAPGKHRMFQAAIEQATAALKEKT